MNFIIRLLVTAILVLLLSNFLPGVHVSDFLTSILVAVVLSLLNGFLKPILILLTLPVTLVTLGLFLLVINAIIILLCTHLVQGFVVDSFFSALVFSIILSVLQSLIYKLTDDNKV